MLFFSHACEVVQRRSLDSGFHFLDSGSTPLIPDSTSWIPDFTPWISDFTLWIPDCTPWILDSDKANKGPDSIAQVSERSYIFHQVAGSFSVRTLSMLLESSALLMRKESVNTLPKVVGFLRALQFPPTGKLTG